MKIASISQTQSSAHKPAMKTPQKPTNSTTKSPGNKCNCLLKLNSFREQIIKINQKIRLLFNLIQMPTQTVECKHQQLSKQMKEQQDKDNKGADGSFQESFLLDGIQCEEFGVGVESIGFKKGYDMKGFEIGRKVVQIYDKIREIQEKSEYMAKFKNNFSMLTKIVEQIQITVEKQHSKANQSQNQENHFINTSCSIEEHEKKTMQTIQKSKKSRKQIDNNRDLIISQISQLRARQSFPLKVHGKREHKVNQS